ncbi:MAG: Trm112 family protein [Pirellulaceae bacterium]|nr:Trm112 family protein [Pirellulaceae bacterium]
MPVSDELLQMLRCPVELSPLRAADAELLARVNRAIDQQLVRDRVGQLVTARLDEGLVNHSGGLLYPVVDEIPSLIADEAIPLDQLPGPAE